MPTQTFYSLPVQKRDHIINIAMAEFAANPYEVASISNIVRKAGIAKGSFYQYFADKKELYRYLIELGNEEKLKLMQSFPLPNPSSDLFSYIRWQFLSAVYFELRHPHLADISFRAFVEEVPFPEMAEELRRRGTTQFFKPLISQGINHGDVGLWVDPDLAAFVMESVFYQFGRYFIDRLGLKPEDTVDPVIFKSEPAQQLLSNLMDILEAGMKREPEQHQTYFTKD